MKKLFAMAVLSACALAAGTAQTVALHGYLDYSNYALGTQNTRHADDAWVGGDYGAEYGSFYDGRTALDMTVDADNFHFETGICLDASLGTWYDLYQDVDDAVDTDDTEDPATLFYKGNIRVDFLNGQAHVYTGKFEDQNFGYSLNGFVFGAMPVSWFAQRDFGQHFTGVELSPYAVDGFSIMAGLPILPVSGNGVNLADHNMYPELLEKVKVGVKFKTPFGVKLLAGYINMVHKEGTSNYSEDGYYREAWLQGDMPNLIPGVALNAGYDFRIREDNDAMHHSVVVGGKFSPIMKLNVALEDRVIYEGEHYLKTNEEALINQLGAIVTYDLPNSMVAGIEGQFNYAIDANGSAVSDGQISSQYSGTDLFGPWMPVAANVASGEAGTYYTTYAYPYIQKNFANGYVRTGVEVLYSNFTTVYTNQAVGVRIPVAMCFWF